MYSTVHVFHIIADWRPQREVRKTRGSARTGYWKLMGRRRWSTLHRNPPPPQLEYTSNHSWAALNKGRRYGTSFAASTFTGLSKCIQPAQAEDGMGPASSYTGSLGGPSPWGRRASLLLPPPPLPCRTLYCTSVQFTNFVRELLVNIASANQQNTGGTGCWASATWKLPQIHIWRRR